MKLAKRVFAGVLITGAATYPHDSIYMRGHWHHATISDDRLDRYEHTGPTKDWLTFFEGVNEVKLIRHYFEEKQRLSNNESLYSNLYLVRGIRGLGLELSARELLPPCTMPEEAEMIWNQIEKQRLSNMWIWWRIYFLNRDQN